jgi:hypothetical protein
LNAGPPPADNERGECPGRWVLPGREYKAISQLLSGRSVLPVGAVVCRRVSMRGCR